MTTHRVERVADLLRHELAQILHEEVRDPRIRDASVTRVEVSSDLQHARVLISLLPGADEASALEGLRRAAGFVRKRLAGRIQLRHVPELRFEIDHGAEHSLRISQLLDSLAPEPLGEAEPGGRASESDTAGLDALEHDNRADPKTRGAT